MWGKGIIVVNCWSVFSAMWKLVLPRCRLAEIPKLAVDNVIANRYSLLANYSNTFSS